jgi:hypothetical protein
MQTIEFTKESLEGLDIGSFNFSLETTRRIQVLIQQSVVNAVNLQRWMEQYGVIRLILVLDDSSEFFSLRVIYSMNTKQRDDLNRMKSAIRLYSKKEARDLVVEVVDKLAPLSQAHRKQGSLVKQVLLNCTKDQVTQIAVDLYSRTMELAFELENIATLYGKHQECTDRE